MAVPNDQDLTLGGKDIDFNSNNIEETSYNHLQKHLKEEVKQFDSMDNYNRGSTLRSFKYFNNGNFDQS